MVRFFKIIFIIAIIISGTISCKQFRRRSKEVRSEINPQARDRIHSPQFQINKHSKDNYHELKHLKNVDHHLKTNHSHQLKQTKKKQHESRHTKDNHHILKHRKKHHEVNNQNRSNTDRIKFSKDIDETDEEMNTTSKDRLDIKFPKTYHATGLLTLPYDGIMEPFEIWYAQELNMSRIDYYYG